MKFTKYINEGLSARKQHVQLSQSSLKDKHIQDTISLIAKTKGVERADIENQFQMMYDKAIENYGTSPISKNEIANLPESIAQKFLQELNVSDLDLSNYDIEDPEEDLLDSDFFFDLTQYVLGENAQFFPLKNPFEKKAVKPYFYITPDNLPSITDPALKAAAKNSCKTAFCTPNAEMVFNRNFCESLALSALIKGVKPKSKKYVSNGGDIPDHYCYLEFVIMHELLHFSAGDHFYTKSMVKKIQKKHPREAGRAHTILNFVGDYINNWTLVKSGYEQLPMGLFSEKVNYDNYKSYEDIIDAVVEELFKISDEDWEKFIEEKQKSMDEHMDNPNDEPSAGGGESEPQQAPTPPQPQDKPETPETQEPDQGDDAQGGDSGEGEPDPEAEPEEGNENGGASGGGPGQVYKVGDIIRINKTGKKAKVVSASEPDENGIQQLDIEEIVEERSEFMSFINEKMISSADVSMWQDSTDDKEDGEKSNGGDSGDSPEETDDTDEPGGSGDDNEGDPQDDSEGDSDGSDGGESTDQDSDQDSEGGGSGGPSDSGSQSDGEPQDQQDSEDIADAHSQAIDDAMKQNQDKVDQRDDGNNDAAAALDKKENVSDADIDKKVGSGTRIIDFKEVKTVVNWKKILKKMIPKGDGEIEDTYAKMSRQATSSMVSVMQTGAGRVSPGEVILDPTKRGLVFVIDNSGSVMREVNKFNQEIMQLLKKHKKLLDNMFIIKFSGEFEVNKVNVGTKIEYKRIMNPAAMLKKSGKVRFGPTKNITALFPETYGSTTDYTIEMHRIIEFLHTQNMNIIMFTDDDLVRDERVKKFYKLSRKRRNSTAMFITDDRSYSNMIKKYGKFPWITVLK